MTKTTYYQLNKPEAGDPMRLTDFNQNADKIDTALNNLNTAVAAKGNCKVAVGTYTGNNKSGSSNPNSVTFAAEPLFLIINGGNYTAYLSKTGRCYSSTGDGSTTYTLTKTWGKKVTWYCSSHLPQMNVSGTTYTYMAFFA